MSPPPSPAPHRSRRPSRTAPAERSCPSLYRSPARLGPPVPTSSMPQAGCPRILTEVLPPSPVSTPVCQQGDGARRLCYLFCRCTRSVSMCPPAYYGAPSLPLATLPAPRSPWAAHQPCSAHALRQAATVPHGAGLCIVCTEFPGLRVGLSRSGCDRYALRSGLEFSCLLHKHCCRRLRWRTRRPPVLGA